jgi:hypothetical protein
MYDAMVQFVPLTLAFDIRDKDAKVLYTIRQTANNPPTLQMLQVGNTTVLASAYVPSGTKNFVMTTQLSSPLTQMFIYVCSIVAETWP